MSSKYLVLGLLYIFSLTFLTAQPVKRKFQLKGTINTDTGTVILVPIAGEAYDPNISNVYKSTIKNGQFIFKGEMKYPCNYLIMVNTNYVSGDFIIEPGYQTIICNIDSLREIPKISNKSMEEYKLYIQDFISPITKQREQAFDKFLYQKSIFKEKQIIDSLQITYSKQRANLINRQQMALFNYIKQYPDSYVALWQIVKEMKAGYQPIFDSAYSALSPSLKLTSTGKVLAQRLNSSRITNIGQSFPTLRLYDVNNKLVSIPLTQKSKYTLIDFWFSHCAPCIAEFPKLRELFDNYESKGFNIVGISIDRNDDIKIWKQTIREKELKWHHYLDPSGKFIVEKLSISYFPSNFLIDEQGIILHKNIKPADLEKFLSEKL